MHKLKVIIQLLPHVRWDLYDDWMNTYLKNFILKQCFRSVRTYKLTTPEQRVDLYTYELQFLRTLTPRFLLPHIKISGVTFLAPKMGMSNLSIEQLAEADTRLSRYLKTEQASYLHTFLACLYEDGAEFCEEVMSYRADLLAKIEESAKVSIIRSYFGSRKLIMQQFPEIFPQGKSIKKHNTNMIPKVEDTGPMWDALIQELANTKGYQGVSTAKKANAWEALGYMNREMIKAQQALEKLKQ